MARKVAFVATISPGTPALIPLDRIPQEIKDEVEEIYAALKTNPNGRMRAEFDTKVELLTYHAQIVAYAALRPVELGGPIRVRRTPTKGLPDTIMDYRITDLLNEKEKETEAIRAAVAAVEVANQTAAPTKAARGKAQ